MTEESVSLEKFTVEDAKNALAKNVVNRPPRKLKIQQYASDMEEGRWNFCADPIVFDEEGNLINGQHRMHAQIKTNMAQNWVVIRKAPKETQNTMDAGVLRSAADTLHFAGEDNAQLMAAVARLVNHIKKGTLGGSRYNTGNEEILRVVQDNPGIRRSTEMAAKAKGGMTPIAPSVLGAAHWMIRQSNTAAEADTFLHRLSTLAGEEEGSPLLALSRRVNELKRNQVRVHARDLLTLVIKAWNYDVEGKSAAKLTYHTRGDTYRTPVAKTRNAAFSDTEED